MSDRLAKVQEQFAAALDARAICDTPAWREAWDGLEREMVERFLACGPEDDLPRFRIAEAMKAARRARKAIEGKARSSETLERELDFLEGRKPRPTA